MFGFTFGFKVFIRSMMHELKTAAV